MRIEAGREASGRARQAEAMKRSGRQDPEKTRLRRSPLPFPGVAIVGGDGAAVKTSLRRAKKRRGLDSSTVPAKTQNLSERGEWELGLGCRRQHCGVPRQKGKETYGFFPLWNPHSSLGYPRGSPLDRGGVLIEDAEKNTKSKPEGAEGAESAEGWAVALCWRGW